MKEKAGWGLRGREGGREAGRWNGDRRMFSFTFVFWHFEMGIFFVTLL